MVKPQSFHDLLVEELKLLYNAEHQIFKIWPRMMRGASHSELRSAFQEQLHHSQEHAAQLEQIFDKFGLPFRGRRCKALGQFLEKSRELSKGKFPAHIRDAGMISVAQKVKHYQMASYGSVRTFSQLVGEEEAADLVQRAFDEEQQIVNKLTRIAQTLEG